MNTKIAKIAKGRQRRGEGRGADPRLPIGARLSPAAATPKHSGRQRRDKRPFRTPASRGSQTRQRRLENRRYGLRPVTRTFQSARKTKGQVFYWKPARPADGGGKG